MSEHTPGPWGVVSQFVGPLEIVADGMVIAHVGHPTFAVCAANARLIAAAPDLHDLASNVGGLSDRAIEHSGAFELRALIREYRDQARAAIAKATGGAQ